MTQLERTANGWFPTIFNEIFDNGWMPRANATTPAINVYQTEKAYTVEIAAPGMTKDDFNIQIDTDGDLVIKMEKHHCNNNNQDANPAQKEAKQYLRREFSYTRFEQRLILPEDIENAQISAKMENGILNITLPKLTPQEEPAKTQQITIE